MQRSMSASSESGRGGHYQNPTPAATPPWERRNVAQVPYMRTNSPPLTETERNALPSFWASQTTTQLQPPLGEHVRAGKGNNYGPSPISPAKDNRDWTNAQQPLSAGLPPTQQMPYESVRIPTAPITAPALPSFVKAPPSPPQSFTMSRSSTTSDNSRTHTASPPVAAPPPPASAPPALPGTMSRRERTPSRSRTRSTWPDKENHSRKSSTDSKPFGQRFKSGFKNMFKRDPIDESQFERIGDKHWTDE